MDSTEAVELDVDDVETVDVITAELERPDCSVVELEMGVEAIFEELVPSPVAKLLLLPLTARSPWALASTSTTESPNNKQPTTPANSMV